MFNKGCGDEDLNLNEVHFIPHRPLYQQKRLPARLQYQEFTCPHRKMLRDPTGKASAEFGCQPEEIWGDDVQRRASFRPMIMGDIQNHNASFCTGDFVTFSVLSYSSTISRMRHAMSSVNPKDSQWQPALKQSIRHHYGFVSMEHCTDIQHSWLSKLNVRNKQD